MMTTPFEREEHTHNEILFREVNERIVDVADPSHPEDDVVVLCECGQPDCLLQIDVPASMYAEVRAHGARFLIAPGHMTEDIERVVQREDAYLVVEKVGRAGRVAEEQDMDS
jgi:hypothetical protein